MKLTVRKFDPGSPSKIHIDESSCLYSSTTYDVRVFADDFRSDAESAATLQLLRRPEEGTEFAEYAACSLIADPYRRDCRRGTLVVNDLEHKTLWDAIAPTDMRNIDDQFMLLVSLGAGASRVIYAQVPVVIAPGEGE